MVGPAGKVGGGVQDGEPGHCYSKADGKIDRRHHMYSHHFRVTFLPAVKVASCKDEQGRIKKCIAKSVLKRVVGEEVEVNASLNSSNSSKNSSNRSERHDDKTLMAKKDNDDGEAANSEG